MLEVSANLCNSEKDKKNVYRDEASFFNCTIEINIVSEAAVTDN